MPSANTFTIPPIAGFVQRYLLASKVSIDPFARNCTWATYTNDLNPGCQSKYHLPAQDFRREMIAQHIETDLVIFDPPYSARQIAEHYAEAGLKPTMQDTQTVKMKSECRRLIHQLLKPGGIVLTFGWNSCPTSKSFELLEILLCCHGGNHNDTICMAEIRQCEEKTML